MPSKGKHHGDSLELRRQAEEIALRGAARALEGVGPQSAEAVRQTLYELQVHQIELEMQNEELRRAQEELDTAEARFFDFYDLAPVGYVTISEEGLILQANLTTATLLGVPRAQLAKQPLTRFILREDQDSYYLLRKQLLATPEPQSRELRMVKSGGPTFWAQLVAVAALDEDGAPAFRVVLSDATERKQVQAVREKLEAQNRLLQKSESLSLMAGAIAHNFNNLLHAVIMGLELAKGDRALDAGHLENLDGAMQSARKAAQVSSLMLTCLGQIQGKREPMELAEVCRQGLALLRATLPDGVRLEIEMPSGGPVIEGDADQIQQVLANLVANAWEAMGDARGRLRVAVQTVAAAMLPGANRYPVDFHPSDTDYACLEVADTGCGIVARDIEKLFDPFFSSKFAGRGLGLPVVLGILRTHGGAITVESEPGQGSTFRVFLPVSRKAVPVQPGRAVLLHERTGLGLPAGPTHASTVLVAEDVPAVRRVVALVLKRLGFAVLTAEDGVAAVEVFQQHADAICCVLCDLTMPRMGGLATLAALRRLAPGIPVILTSGYSEAVALAGAQTERPHAFLNKPYTPEALVGAITQALAQRKS